MILTNQEVKHTFVDLLLLTYIKAMDVKIDGILGCSHPQGVDPVVLVTVSKLYKRLTHEDSGPHDDVANLCSFKDRSL